MKKYRNNTATAYAYANQTSEAGQSSNLFFIGDTAYSYGGHYEIAKRVKTPNGKPLYFVNSNGYSNTTAKHTNEIVRQLDRECALFVPFPRNRFTLQELPLIIERLKIDTANAYREQIKARTNTCKYLRGDRFLGYIQIISALFNVDGYTPTESVEMFTLREKAVERSQQIEKTRQDIINRRIKEGK